MILSNEPGYYREGAFGIRIENLIVVEAAAEMGDKRDQLSFETLSWVPIDRRLVDTTMMASWEIEWLDTYHKNVREKIGPHVDGADRDWLEAATQPL